MPEVRIVKYIHGNAPVYQRYEDCARVPGYKDITNLWVLTNEVVDKIYVSVDRKSYKITRTAEPGLIIDKASKPGNRDWYPAVRAVLWHDIDTSTKPWVRFSEHDDGGFRFGNSLFRESIDYHIRWSHQKGSIGRFRRFLWNIRKRLWYRGVGSIKGQGIFVNTDRYRGYHNGFSRTAIKEMG